MVLLKYGQQRETEQRSGVFHYSLAWQSDMANLAARTNHRLVHSDGP